MLLQEMGIDMSVAVDQLRSVTKPLAMARFAEPDLFAGASIVRVLQISSMTPYRGRFPPSSKVTEVLHAEAQLPWLQPLVPEPYVVPLNMERYTSVETRIGRILL